MRGMAKWVTNSLLSHVPLPKPLGPAAKAWHLGCPVLGELAGCSFLGCCRLCCGLIYPLFEAIWRQKGASEGH